LRKLRVLPISRIIFVVHASKARKFNQMINFNKGSESFVERHKETSGLTELHAGDIKMVYFGGCLLMHILKSGPEKVIRISIDLSRLEYHDPAGSNTKLLRELSSDINLDLLDQKELLDLSLDSHLLFKLGLKKGLLVEVCFYEDGSITSILLDDVLVSWEQMLKDAPPGARLFPTDDLEALIAGPYSQFSWMIAYHDTKNVVVIEKCGFPNW
jgi:hypothetical protein